MREHIKYYDNNQVHSNALLLHIIVVIIFVFSLAIGPCITRRASDAQLRCDDDGNFEPLQCRRMDDGTHTCRCVHPGNGSTVANTMRTGIRQREDAPDCEARGMGLAKPASLIIIKGQGVKLTFSAGHHQWPPTLSCQCGRH